ncbi:MAG: transposase [Candidatus Symbiothrix sp.]|nr:transposase [Candidatus Symbiothrix sp.]
MSICELLEQTGKIYTDKNVSIILDSAKYQRCNLVAQYAGKLHIALLFLPSYSPCLNIMERLWNRTKKECLNCKYSDTFAEFKTAVDNALSKTKNHENNRESDTLSALNFQLYDNDVYVQDSISPKNTRNRHLKSSNLLSILNRGAYFFKNKSEIPFYRHLGEVFCAVFKFSGQQYF